MDGEDAAGGDGGRSPSMRADTRSAPRRISDAGVVPRRRGAGRAIGVALSLLAVTAAGAVGGHHFWKTEFARPVLVRRPPPASAMEATPSRIAGVAAEVAGESGNRRRRAAGEVPDAFGRRDAGAGKGRGIPDAFRCRSLDPGRRGGPPDAFCRRATRNPGTRGSGVGQGVRCTRRSPRFRQRSMRGGQPIMRAGRPGSRSCRRARHRESRGVAADRLHRRLLLLRSVQEPCPQVIATASPNLRDPGRNPDLRRG